MGACTRAIWQYTAAGSDELVLPDVLLVASWTVVTVNVAMAVLDRRHRALHDRLGSSLVVRGAMSDDPTDMASSP